MNKGLCQTNNNVNSHGDLTVDRLAPAKGEAKKYEIISKCKIKLSLLKLHDYGLTWLRVLQLTEGLLCSCWWWPDAELSGSPPSPPHILSSALSLIRNISQWENDNMENMLCPAVQGCWQELGLMYSFSDLNKDVKRAVNKTAFAKAS